MKKKKVNMLPLIVSVIGIIFIAFFPLVIWDSLGTDAIHFAQYGYAAINSDLENISGSAFSTLYSSGFSAFDLYSGKWRIVEDVHQFSGTPSSDILAVFTLIFVIALILICLYEVAIYFVKKFGKDWKVFGLIDEIATITIILVSSGALIFIGVPTVAMASKVGESGFTFQDFTAYGGFKGAIECALALFFIVYNIIKYNKSLVMKPKRRKEYVS